MTGAGEDTTGLHCVRNQPHFQKKRFSNRFLRFPSTRKGALQHIRGCYPPDGDFYRLLIVSLVHLRDIALGKL
ncbi:hypothetical protein NQZ68_017341 [Dissostichus eleginoides]|nr:hypothetical protein NQZ68_017341 [Dissostichus eleginoides]